jgi:hypothetical protein
LSEEEVYMKVRYERAVEQRNEGGPTIEIAVGDIDESLIIKDAALRLGENPATIEDARIVTGYIRTLSSDSMLLSSDHVSIASEFTVLHMNICHYTGLNPEIAAQSDTA